MDIWPRIVSLKWLQGLRVGLEEQGRGPSLLTVYTFERMTRLCMIFTFPFLYFDWKIEKIVKSIFPGVDDYVLYFRAKIFSLVGKVTGCSVCCWGFYFLNPFLAAASSIWIFMVPSVPHPYPHFKGVVICTLIIFPFTIFSWSRFHDLHTCFICFLKFLNSYHYLVLL